MALLTSNVWERDWERVSCILYQEFIRVRVRNCRSVSTTLSWQYQWWTEALSKARVTGYVNTVGYLVRVKLGIHMRIFALHQCADYARASYIRVQVRRAWHVLCLL